MPLDVHTQGYWTWNIGLDSAMSTMIIRDTDRSLSGFVISLGVANSFISANHMLKINKADLKLRVYGQ